MRIVRHTQNYSSEVWSDALGEHLNIVQRRTKMHTTLTEDVEISGYDNLRQLRDDLTTLLETALVD